MNILITSASRKVWLIRAFQHGLSEAGGGQVIAVDANPKSAALYFADKSYVIPAGLGEGFLEAVRDICSKHSIELIVPTRDEELPVFAAAREGMQSIGVTVMVPDAHVVEICQDKQKFINFCIRNGFSVPKTYENAEIGSISEFPLFLKERFGKGSRGTYLAVSRQDLNHLLKRLKQAIVQQYINAQEYTVDLFADFSGEVITVVPRERLVTFSGESFVGRTCKNWNIIHETIRLGKALELKGHNTIQCFSHNGKVKFIEVNPRYGGGANLSFAAGALTPLYLVRLLKGEEIKPAIGEFEDGYMMLRYTEDLFLNSVEVNRVERLD